MLLPWPPDQTEARKLLCFASAALGGGVADGGLPQLPWASLGTLGTIVYSSQAAGVFRAGWCLSKRAAVQQTPQENIRCSVRLSGCRNWTWYNLSRARTPGDSFPACL